MDGKERGKTYAHFLKVKSILSVDLVTLARKTKAQTV